MVDAAAGRDRQSRAKTDSNLPVRRAGRGALVIVVERDLARSSPWAAERCGSGHQGARRRRRTRRPRASPARTRRRHASRAWWTARCRASRRRDCRCRNRRPVEYSRCVIARRGLGRYRHDSDDSHARLTAVRNLVHADVRIAFLEHRATQERRDRHLMPGTHVVHGLGLRIDEAERESSLGIDPLDQIVEIAATDRREPRSLAAGDRTFTEERRARAAQACAAAELVAAAFAGRQANLGAHLAARALRIAAREQGHTAQRLAVDHRDRAAVGDAVDGVHQIPRRDAVDHQPDVAERIAADRELAVEVVGRRGGGQGLHGP